MPQTIMIAASDPNITYLLQRYAEESGFQTISVSQGKEILSLAQHTQPALIILHAELPEAANHHVLRCLKAEPATRHIPIVIYSCLGQETGNFPDDIDGYLRESVMYDDFLAALRRAGVYS
jgi:CheY-like chemotaxis protein